MDRYGFTAALMEACGQLPGVVRVESAPRDKIRIVVAEEGERECVMVLSIGNFYRDYRLTGNVQAAIDRPLGMLRTILAEQTRLDQKTFADLQPRIYPKLEMLSHLEDGKQCLHRPWLADLGIGYVVDSPTHTSFIRAPHASGWGVDQATIERTALTNLRKLALTTPVARRRLSDTCTVIASETQDGFDATRILLPEVIRTWFTPAEWRQGILLAIPIRDLFLATTKNQQNYLSLIAVMLTALKRPYRLTPQVFTFDQRGQLMLFPQEGDLHVN